MRSRQREVMGFPEGLSFLGTDIWNCYELSWLNNKGKPVRATASFLVPCSSPYLAESKSVKLYLNSFNHHCFGHESEVKKTIECDISEVCQAPVEVIMNPASLANMVPNSANFYCLDELDVAIDTYERNPGLLEVDPKIIANERLFTHLYKSHCLCTGQPDWGSIFIDYEGPAINRASMLKYLISYYDHVGFAENCIEQIYVDIMKHANPKKLSIFGRFTRRGGIDINPYRSNIAMSLINDRLIFQ